jgi:hypothetical protein
MIGRAGRHLPPGGTIISRRAATPATDCHRRGPEGLSLHLRDGHKQSSEARRSCACARRWSARRTWPRKARATTASPPGSPGTFRRVQARPVLNEGNEKAHEATTGPGYGARRRPDRPSRRERRDRRTIEWRRPFPEGPGQRRRRRADPEGSVLSGDHARPYLTEGMARTSCREPMIHRRRPLGPGLRRKLVRRRPPADPGRGVGRSGGTALVAVRRGGARSWPR